MVFNKNVERRTIEAFENNTLRKISVFPMFILLKSESSRRKLICRMEVQRSESDLNKYHSELAIDIYDADGEIVRRYDEPNCSLMICETICFVHRGHIVGIDLLNDKDFLDSLELLIEGVVNTHGV